MTEPLNRVRKGDAVALRVEHSITCAGMWVKRYARWSLATVHQATHDGWAKRVVMAGTSHPIDVARGVVVFTLPGKDIQAAAKRMIEESPYPAREYDYAEELKAAIRAAIRAEP